MDLAQLAQFLAPFLPYLLDLSAKAAEEAAKKFGSDTSWKLAQKIWVKLHHKVEAQESAKEAAKDVASDPNNQDYQTALKVQLQKILSLDPTLEKEIAELMTMPKKVGHTTYTDQSSKNTAGRDVTIAGRDVKQNTGVNLLPGSYVILFIIVGVLALLAVSYWMLGIRTPPKGSEFNPPSNPQSQPTPVPSKPSKNP